MLVVPLDISSENIHKEENITFIHGIGNPRTIFQKY